MLAMIILHWISQPPEYVSYVTIDLANDLSYQLGISKFSRYFERSIGMAMAKPNKEQNVIGTIL